MKQQATTSVPANFADNDLKQALLPDGEKTDVQGEDATGNVFQLVTHEFEHFNIQQSLSPERSRVAANSAVFVINTVCDFTLLGIAATGANYVAERFTLWAEKKIARSIAARLQPASTTPPTAAFSR